MKEFTVVLLAGGTNRLSNDLSIGKALLPVGNRPLIWYSIEMIRRNVVLSSSDLIVVTSSSMVKALNDYLSTLNLNYQLVTYQENQMKLDKDLVDGKEKKSMAPSNLGSFDCLRLCSPLIRSKSICLLTADLFGRVDLNSWINSYRTRENSLSMILVPSPIKDQTIQPGQKRKFLQEPEYYFIDETNNQLKSIRVRSSELEENLFIDENLLVKSSRTRIRSDLTDIHLYLFEKRWLDCSLRCNDRSFRKQVLVKQLDQNISEQETRSSSIDESSITQSSRVFIEILSTPSVFRVHNVLSYFEANRQASSIIKLSSNDEIQQRDRYEGAQISSDSLIETSSDVGKKTTIKSSIIGKCCQIEDKCRLINSILLDQVHIKEGTTINNSIISSGSIVGNKCEIVNSIVSSNQSVDNSKKVNNETISSSKVESEVFNWDDDEQEQR